jgi:hypothetical protein
LYTTLKEIEEVQYAQNYNEMILVHENYRPLHIRLVGSQSAQKALEVLTLPIGIAVDVEKSGNEDDKATYSPSETDKDYNSYGYLTTSGNYPRSVSFFNGRLVFAGTKNNPQRIFAGSVGKKNGVYDFATYTLFLTFSREYYITVYGTLNMIDNTFEPEDSIEFSKFVESYPRYYVASLSFPKGTMIAGVVDSKILFTQRNQGYSISDDERTKLSGWYTWYNSLPMSDPYLIYSIYDSGGRPVSEDTTELAYNMSGFSISWRRDDDLRNYTFVSIGTPNDVKRLMSDFSEFDAWVRENLPQFSRPAVVTSFISDFYAHLQAGTKYTVTTTTGATYTLYGTPEQIYQQILGMSGSEGPITKTYLSFYAIKIIEDRYPTPDDGFTNEIASARSDAIRWIAQNKNLLVGTETAEWVIPAGVTATNVQAVLNSRYGSDRIQGTSVGDAMCFFQSGRKALVEYYIPQQDNNFRANNMAMLSKNMLHESAAFDFDFISAPYTKLFVSREDGIIVALLYERSTGTFAWGRIRTNGNIESVATVPGGSGYDDVYLIVERIVERIVEGVVEKKPAYFLEMLAERRRSTDAPDAEVFLDSYQKWTGKAEGYETDAAVYDELNNKTYTIDEAEAVPAWTEEHPTWIGYPYTSRVRSMPILANNQMKPNNIKSLSIRLNDSFLPKIGSFSLQDGQGRPGAVDRISRREPYGGIVQVPFPGVWDRDVFFELIHDTPTRCRVLAVNAEVN